MASPTKKSKVRRKLNKARAGKKRKNKLRIVGSTAPSLKLNMPNAGEKAAIAAAKASV
ncbi:MAG: hypothetical protein H7249_17420 [Chitinophagaceae bacterium]|nr:hypothetical protein [Oligoflexus sp.]